MRVELVRAVLAAGVLVVSGLGAETTGLDNVYCSDALPPGAPLSMRYSLPGCDRPAMSYASPLGAVKLQTRSLELLRASGAATAPANSARKAIFSADLSYR